MLNKFKLLKKEESGQVLVLFALLLVVLLGFAALVIDVGYVDYQKSYLQTAADSAALAGAIEIPKSTDDSKIKEDVVNKFADLNNLDLKKPLTIISNIDRTEGTVTVDITQVVPKFFAGFITSDDYSLTVHAKAKYSLEWSGQALPFLNLDDDYTDDDYTTDPNPEIVAWEKTGPGDFESIWKDDFNTFYGGKDDDHSKTYFTVDYQDGITITKGTVADIKQEVGYVYDQHKPVYIFSLSSAAIESGKYSSVANKQVVPLKDLVLLKCIFHDYDYSGKTLYLKVTEVYDIANNVFPQNYTTPDAKVTSRLIE